MDPRDRKWYEDDSPTLSLQIIEANLFAGTWVFSSLLRGFDRGEITKLTLKELSRSEHSFNFTVELEYALPYVKSLILGLVFYLLSRRDDRRQFRQLLERFDRFGNELNETLIPVVRAVKFMITDDKAKLRELRINDEILTKQKVDLGALKEVLDELERRLKSQK